MCTIETIMKALHQAAEMYPIKRMDLFGSYANGVADEKSDVDLLVEFSKQPTTLLSFVGCRKRYLNCCTRRSILWNCPSSPTAIF